MSYNPNLAVIAAYDLDRGIGKGGKLPWHIPEDLQRFKRITEGSIVIMGRKTFESLPTGPLPGRLNVVVTRNKRWQADGTLVAHNLNQAIQFTQGVARQFVIGGQDLFEEAIGQAGYAYLTEVQGYFGCDRYFPRFDHSQWSVTYQFGTPGVRFIDMCRKDEVVDMDAVYANAEILRQNPTLLGGLPRA